MMDLSRMNRNDLTALQGKLQLIGIASEALARGGLEPLISLTGDASVITVEPILSYGPVADVVLIENTSIEIAPPQIPADAPSTLESVLEDMQAVAATEYAAPLAAMAQMKADAGVVGRKLMPSVPVSSDLVTGPMSAGEKATIAQMVGRGALCGEIATALNRKPQVIALYLSRWPHGVGAAVVKTEAAVAVPVAEIQLPGGDREGLQQHRPVEHDPVQSGVVDGQRPVATPDEARLSFTGESKRIWDHVKSLGFPKGWDADLDLEMCEAFGRGTKADQVALDLDCDTKLLRDRYADLTACIRDDRGRMSIDGQERLVRVLQERLRNLRATKAA